MNDLEKTFLDSPDPSVRFKTYKYLLVSKMPGV